MRTIFESLSGLEADLSRTRPPRLGLGDPIRFVLLEFGFMLGAQSLCSGGRSRVSELETRMVPFLSKEIKFDRIMLFGKRDLFVSKFAFVTKNTAFVCREVEADLLALCSLWFVFLQLFVFNPGEPSHILILPNLFFCGRCSRISWSAGGCTAGT